MEELTRRLERELVVLEPLRESDAEDLWQAAQAPEIWTWLVDLGANRALFDEWLRLSLEASAAGREGVFVVRRREDGAAVGSSRYLNVRPADRVVEIGWTWFNPSVWKTGVNVETKLLMFTRAFETLGCVRVELKTDARNERSRGAMVRLPARFEGIMRKHQITPDVGQRDSAYYSVIDDEWPTVREALESRLTSVTALG